MFVLPEAAAARGADLGTRWASSLTMGVEQFFTNLGIAVVIDGPDANEFANAASEGLKSIAAHYLFDVPAEDWIANEVLSEEVFGPLSLVIRVKGAAQMRAVAASFKGQLTATLQMDDGDIDLARCLLPVREQMAGRVLANGFPPGVDACDAMVHGGRTWLRPTLGQPRSAPCRFAGSCGPYAIRTCPRCRCPPICNWTDARMAKKVRRQCVCRMIRCRAARKDYNFFQMYCQNAPKSDFSREISDKRTTNPQEYPKFTQNMLNLC
ncbi:hypothetical protein SAMN06295998_13121 [Primorskyibacter flagellatus]|uniref:Aldehyde dehydrogenase family protein n=1 Tax=Primorskyibacter flagellatus TaxID=1387277 RepID=A0A1W2EL56_9RHOB|nr:hypothetical protein SAMN06295998_13121 [Primorskyibacter flagellatus]